MEYEQPRTLFLTQTKILVQKFEPAAQLAFIHENVCTKAI